VRTKNFMATITGYRYKDPAGSKGKYMFRPDGGSISHLWMAGAGFLQASSPTIYTRPEPMSFPEAPGVSCLTPRIEYTDSLGYFTNLFEFDSRLAMDSGAGQYRVRASGELKDMNALTGGVGYCIDYLFGNDFIEKSIRLNWHDARPLVRIIEPVIQHAGTSFEQKGPAAVLIRTGRRVLEIRLLTEGVKLVTGRNAETYWTPYPALKAYPIELEVQPNANSLVQTVRYRISIVE